MQKESSGEAAERWVKEFVHQSRLLSSKEFPLEQVVRLFDTKLQLRLASARLHIDKFLPFANDWIDLILNDKRLPERSSKQAKTELTQKLLDLVLATDLVLSIRNNQGKEHIICVDVTSALTKEKSKLNTIQGKREDGEPTGFNRNQNLPAVRKELGIDKHLVLVVNPNHPPDRQLLLSELYAFANRPIKTGVINLHSYTPQAAITNQVSSSQQLTREAQVEPNVIKLISTLERLPDRELVNTLRRVQNYFASSPPQPPTEAERLAVQRKVDGLFSQIQNLWQRQGLQLSLTLPDTL